MDDVSCSQVVKLPNYMSKDVIDDLTVFGGTFGRVQTKFHKKSKYKIFPNDQNNSKLLYHVHMYSYTSIISRSTKPCRNRQCSLFFNVLVFFVN